MVKLDCLRILTPPFQSQPWWPTPLVLKQPVSSLDATLQAPESCPEHQMHKQDSAHAWAHGDGTSNVRTYEAPSLPLSAAARQVPYSVCMYSAHAALAVPNGGHPSPSSVLQRLCSGSGSGSGGVRAPCHTCTVSTVQTRTVSVSAPHLLHNFFHIISWPSSHKFSGGASTDAGVALALLHPSQGTSILVLPSCPLLLQTHRYLVAGTRPSPLPSIAPHHTMSTPLTLSVALQHPRRVHMHPVALASSLHCLSSTSPTFSFYHFALLSRHREDSCQLFL